MSVRFAIGLLALALNLGLSIGQEVTAIPSSGLSAAMLVPDGALAVVVIPSFDAFKDRIAGLAKHFGEEEEAATDVEGMLRPLGAVAQYLDRSAPIVTGLSPGEDGAKPDPFFMIPVTDVAKVQEAMPGLIASGSYIAFPPGAGVQRETPHPILANLPARDVVVRADLGRTMKIYGPMAEAGIGMMAGSGGAMMLPGVDVDALAEDVAEFVRAFGLSADILELVTDLEGPVVRMDGNLSLKADSPLGKASTQYRSAAPALASIVSGSHHLAIAASIPLGGFTAFAKEMMTGLAEMSGGAVNDSQLKLFNETLVLFDYLTGDLGGFMDFTPDGLSGLLATRAKDPAAYIDGYVKLLGSDGMTGMGVTPEPVVERMVGDVKVREMKIKWTDAFFEQASEGMGDPAQIRKMMETIYGKEGMRFAMAAVGSDVLWAMGPAIGQIDAAIPTLLAAKGTGGDLKSGLERAGTAPCFVASLELGSLMKEVAVFGEMMGEPIPDLSKIGPCRLSFHAGASPLQWRFGADIDFAGLGRLVEAMEGF